MACGVAVKRSLELDSLLSPDSSMKRRRTSINAGHCVPFRPTFSNSPPHQQQQQNSDFQQTTGASANAMPSALISTQPKISQEELESYLMSEIQSLRRRQPAADLQDGESSGGNSDSDSDQRMDSGTSSRGMQPHGTALNMSPFTAQGSPTRVSSPPAHSNRPLFTYTQVRMICERLLKEQEARIREEYDQVLNARLAEQYDTFVRFTYDQIHRRIDDSPMTYLS